MRSRLSCPRPGLGFDVSCLCPARGAQHERGGALADRRPGMAGALAQGSLVPLCLTGRLQLLQGARQGQGLGLGRDPIIQSCNSMNSASCGDSGQRRLPVLLVAGVRAPKVGQGSGIMGCRSWAPLDPKVQLGPLPRSL